LSVFLPCTYVDGKGIFKSYSSKDIYVISLVGSQVQVEGFVSGKGAVCSNFQSRCNLPFTISCTRDKVYIAPSGVQKERIEPEHIFVLPYPQPTTSPHTDRVFLRRPQLNLNESACTPLFWNSFDLRDAGSCIHTHSQHAVMATLLWKESIFTISHQVRLST